MPALAQALGYELVFDEFCGDYFDAYLGRRPPARRAPLDILRLIEETIARYRDSGLSGVTSGVGYPGMSVCSIVARQLGLPGPAPETVITLEHKYYSRLAQRQFVPEAVPEFRLVDPRCPGASAEGAVFPLFLKPVKSCMSIGAYRLRDAGELRERAPAALLPDGFLKPFNDLLKKHTGHALDASYLLLETALQGAQVSLEGYVCRGEVHVLGILDAIMFPDTISFRRFQYPSRLSESVQERMRHIARTLMGGLEYDNAPFNIELMYDPRGDRIHVIEVNPKIASQFADLFLKVDGQSSFSVLLQLAVGEAPALRTRQGAFRVAASCVLRTFEDKRVLAIPSSETIDEIVSDYPEARIEIHATPGTNLSDQMQDAQSFRYGLVHVGAGSERELEDKFARIASRLHYELAPVLPAPAVTA